MMFPIAQAWVDDVLLVTDEAITAAQRLYASHAHTLAEGAGAASLAALLDLRTELAGRTVALVCTGGNANPAELAALGRAENAG